MGLLFVSFTPEPYSICSPVLSIFNLNTGRLHILLQKKKNPLNQGVFYFTIIDFCLKETR